MDCGTFPWRTMLRWIGRSCWRIWSVAWLLVLLAFVTAIPVFQLMALGYLLFVAGRLASGETLANSVRGIDRAGKIGVALTALGLASLPSQLLTHWESVAAIIQPGSGTAETLRVSAIALAVFATIYLWWAWARGGTLRHYLWPEPVRFVKQVWRPTFWSDVSLRLWDFVLSLRLPMLFWLGLRGAAGTLVWLVPAMVIMVVTREGQHAAAGLLGGLCLLVLGYILMVLPALQANYAAENRLAALFEFRRVRRDSQFAPWSYAGALLVALVLMPIPLYLLKIEATPEEIVWLPCLVFVAFMLPARMATGLALRRGRRLRRAAESDAVMASTATTDPSGMPVAERVTAEIGVTEVQRSGQFASGFWPTASRWTVRGLVAPAIVAVYLFVLFGSQFTSWDGVDTWVRQHALLVPVPFVGI